MKFIPYGRQDISDEDINAVVGVLKSDFLTQGPCVPQFEQAIADYVGVKHAVAAASDVYKRQRLHFILHAWHWGLKKVTGCGHRLTPSWLRQTVGSIAMQM